MNKKLNQESRIISFPKKSLAIVVIGLFLTTLLAPVDYTSRAAGQQRPRNGWLVGCPPPTDVMYRKFGPINFNPQNDPYDGARRMRFDSVWIGITDGGQYKFIVTGTSSKTPFLVDAWHRESPNGINQNPPWIQIVNAAWSAASFGGGQKFEFFYNSRAHAPNIASVDVFVRLYPQDQQNPSDYVFYFDATNCLKANSPPPPPPNSNPCRWEQNTVLGQPSGPCYCLCNGRPAADSQCPQPKPRC